MPPIEPNIDAAANTASKDLAAEGLGLPPVLHILGKINQGGIGAVFKAEHLVTRAKLAIKVLLPELAAVRSHQRRFIQEARAMCSLSNPHIVSVHDCGFTESGLPYMIMDYVEGRTLEEELVEHPLAAEEALDIFIQIAEGVAHAHKRSIIHRDLKPSNIMLSRQEDGRLFVKVLDFGIAKVKEEANIQGLQNLTAMGEVLGTPSYMSPEQSLGTSVDERTDIYSLGCVMFHTLAGTPPFTAATALQLLAQQTNSPVPDLKEVRPDLKLPPGLDRIVRRTLEKKPIDRYPNMEELLADLAKVKEGKSVAASLTGRQRQSLIVAFNVVLWFSIFYCAGQFAPTAFNYLQNAFHFLPDFNCHIPHS